MTAPFFVDTNVLVYARDSTESDKQASAQAWLKVLWKERLGRISFQVLKEYYQVRTRKLALGAPHEVREDIRQLLKWRPVIADHRVFQGAWSLEDRFSLSWWDALIVSAAQVSGCGSLLSEDLQDGQDFDGLRVVNPFSHSPPDLG